MALDNWKKSGAGNLILNPLTGFDTAAMLDGAAGMVRIEFAVDPSMKTRDAVQLAITAKQARDLIAGLSEMADRLDSITGDDRPQGPLS